MGEEIQPTEAKPRRRNRLPLIVAIAVLLALTAGLLFLARLRQQSDEGGIGYTDPPLRGTAQPVSTANPDEVNLVAFGDWGQNTPAERQVAHAIGAYGVAFDAGLLLGDNFYVPLTGVNDPKWQTLFEDLYEPHALRFWAVLGNHDYRTAAILSRGTGGPPKPNPTGPRPANKDVEYAYSRLHPNGRFNLPAQWYRLDIPQADPWVTVIMLDSNYRDRAFGGDAAWKAQLDWLAAQLEDVRPTDSTRPRRRWVVCCAHHPIFTNGISHADDDRLKTDWLPLFERHGVDFYLAGHNHSMEHVQVAESPVSFVVAGGGGAALYGQKPRHPGWFAKSHGFAHLSLHPDRAEMNYVDEDAKLLRRFTRTPGGPEQVTFSVPTALPTTAPDPEPAETDDD